MFYWHHKGVHVILNDDQEKAIADKLFQDAAERIRAMISLDGQSEWNRRISAYLLQQFRKDPDTFIQQYVVQEYKGNEAQEAFPFYVDVYGSITRRAAVSYATKPWTIEIEMAIRWFGEYEAMQLYPDEYERYRDTFRITIFDPGRGWWIEPRPCGRLYIPRKCIDTLVGSPDNFMVFAQTMTLHFGRDGIEIEVGGHSQA